MLTSQTYYVRNTGRGRVETENNMAVTVSMYELKCDGG